MLIKAILVKEIVALIKAAITALVKLIRIISSLLKFKAQNQLNFSEVMLDWIRTTANFKIKVNIIR